MQRILTPHMKLSVLFMRLKQTCVFQTYKELKVFEGTSIYVNIRKVVTRDALIVTRKVQLKKDANMTGYTYTMERRICQMPAAIRKSD